MKRSNVIGILAAAAVIVLSVVLISWYLTKRTPTLIQGTVECTTYKASSKVPGRIDDMKVAQGDRVEKGQLLYTLSTPELEAKLRQAEAVKSAAAALDAMALAGARVQQIEAALPFQMHEPLGARERRHTLGAQLAQIGTDHLVDSRVVFHDQYARAANHSALDDHEVVSGVGEHVEAVVGHDAEVLQAHAELARQVDTGLHRDDVAGRKRPLIARGEHRLLVDVDAHAVTEPVPHAAAEAGRRQHLLVGGTGSSQPDVLQQAGVEQELLLSDEGDLLVQRGEGHLSQVLPPPA